MSFPLWCVCVCVRRVLFCVNIFLAPFFFLCVSITFFFFLSPSLPLVSSLVS
jgi:hypothetical protein